MGLVVLRALLFAVLSCWSPGRARADVDTHAQQLFARGVELAQQKRWQEAAAQFEASLAREERAATRFNLVLTYAELEAPLRVVQHALAFLALPERERRAAAREHVRQRLAEAAQGLARLSTASLPADVQLDVDGRPITAGDAAAGLNGHGVPVAVRDPAGMVYLEPGAHRLEARGPAIPADTVEVVLAAGEVRTWPLPNAEDGRDQNGEAAPAELPPRASRAEAAVGASPRGPPRAPAGTSTAHAPPRGPQRAPAGTSAVAAPPPGPQGAPAGTSTADGPRRTSDFAVGMPVAESTPPVAARLRRSLAWTLGVLGAGTQLAALGGYGASMRRQARLADDDPMLRGFFSASQAYLRVQNSVIPLAFTGAALSGAAIALGPRAARWGSRALAWSALAVAAALLGTGVALSAREPASVVEGSDLVRPTRQAAGLIASYSMPLLCYGLGFLVTHPARPRRDSR